MIKTFLENFTPKDTRMKGIAAALTGTMLISFDSVFIRLSGTNGFNTAFLFGFFTMISMGLIIQTTDDRGVIGTLKESGWPVIVSGFLMLGSASTFILSIKHTAIANTVIIIGCQPVLTGILSWILLRERTGRNLWVAIAFVIFGVLIVVSGSLESGNLLGDSLAVITVTCLSLNRIIQRKYKKVSRMAIVGMGGFFLTFSMFFLADIKSFTSETWIIMGLMGLASAPVGRVLNAMSTRYILAAESSMIALILTVFSTLWAFLLFNEIPPLTTVLGGFIIIGSISTYIMTTLKATGANA